MDALLQPVRSKNLQKAFVLMQKKKLADAEKLLESGLKEAESKKDLTMSALYCSAFGVLFKLKKEFRKAWKFYERAEKIYPEEPSLKLISGRLLVDYFGQYDTVIRKMEKVIERHAGNPVLLHQALTLKGIAHLRQGQKDKAIESLKRSMEDGFEPLKTCVNLDFKLVEEMMKKKVFADLCREFLEKANALSRKSREKGFQKMTQRLLDNFPSPL